MNVYSYDDYRNWIRDSVEFRKKIASDVNFSQLSSDTGIQRTFLSRVLAKEAHLSSDQLYLICDFFSLAETESRYLQLLLEVAKTRVEKRKISLLREITELQKKYLSTDSVLDASPVMVISVEDLQKYFLDPYMPMVHVLLTVERFATAPIEAAGALGLDPIRFDTIVQQLQRMRLIEKQDNGFRVLTEKMHLPKDSPLWKPYALMQRLKSMEQIQKLPDKEAYAFSATFASDESARQQIRAEFMKFLKVAQDLAGAQPGKRIFQMNFDLFPWIGE